MEVLTMPGPQDHFHFVGSVPTSPRRFVDAPFDFHNHYTSAPTSPTRAAAIYQHFNSITAKPVTISTASHVPFDWEVVPGTPKSCGSVCDDESDDDDDALDDFSFDVSRQTDELGVAPTITTADELFEEGKIRPLKLPPRLQYPEAASSIASSPRTPRSPRGLLSPRRRGGRGSGEEFDPFIAAMVETTRDPNSRSRKASRSLSPFRGRGFFSKNSNSKQKDARDQSSGSSGKKWRLKDLLLFRSVSEGRASGERSSLLSSSSGDSRNTSFRSVDDGSRLSAQITTVSSILQNERRYAQRRVALEEFSKKSSLADRQGLFGCLRFDKVCRGFGNGQ